MNRNQFFGLVCIYFLHAIPCFELVCRLSASRSHTHSHTHAHTHQPVVVSFRELAWIRAAKNRLSLNKENRTKRSDVRVFKTRFLFRSIIFCPDPLFEEFTVVLVCVCALLFFFLAAHNSTDFRVIIFVSTSAETMAKCTETKTNFLCVSFLNSEIYIFFFSRFVSFFFSSRRSLRRFRIYVLYVVVCNIQYVYADSVQECLLWVHL